MRSSGIGYALVDDLVTVLISAHVYTVVDIVLVRVYVNIREKMALGVDCVHLSLLKVLLPEEVSMVCLGVAGVTLLRCVVYILVFSLILVYCKKDSS